MKKGFFLLASMAALFNHRSVGGVNLKTANATLDNCPSFSRGGNPSKGLVTNIFTRKQKQVKKIRRTAKQSRNINHKKAA